MVEDGVEVQDDIDGYYEYMGWNRVFFLVLVGIVGKI